MRPHFMKLIPNVTVTFFLKKKKKKRLNWCQINGEVDTTRFSRYSNLYELSSYIILASTQALELRFALDSFCVTHAR